MTGLLAVIPARGGSKGLPGKNISDLGGAPLIAWSIVSAKKARSVDRVIVSTDDEEIARIASEWGAEVAIRPAELATDTASTYSVIANLIEGLASDGQADAEKDIAILQPTTPFRPPRYIDSAAETFAKRRGEIDSLIGVSRLPKVLGRIEDGNFIPGGPTVTRSQEIDATWYINGTIYILRNETAAGGKGPGTRIAAMPLPDSRMRPNIDSMEDLELAKAILSAHPDWFMGWRPPARPGIVGQ